MIIKLKEGPLNTALHFFSSKTFFNADLIHFLKLKILVEKGDSNSNGSTNVF